MKKFIALSLIVVCLGCFSLGCKTEEKAPAKPAETPAAGGGADPAPAETTPEAPAE